MAAGDLGDVVLFTLRIAALGTALLLVPGIAVAWAGHILWLFVAAVGILGEELLETSVIIAVLKRNPPGATLRRRVQLSL